MLILSNEEIESLLTLELALNLLERAYIALRSRHLERV
jgi:hypothetical protein